MKSWSKSEFGRDWIPKAIRGRFEDLRKLEKNGADYGNTSTTQVIRVFGHEYFSMLTEWLPMKPDPIPMAEMLVDKSERFDTPLPEMSAGSKPAIADPRLSWQLAIKFIDLTRVHLESLSRIRKAEHRRR